MGNNTSDYNRQYYLKNRDKIIKRSKNQAEYQKKYRAENKERLAKYHLDYIRSRSWLNGSDNYSGELG